MLPITSIKVITQIPNLGPYCKPCITPDRQGSEGANGSGMVRKLWCAFPSADFIKVSQFWNTNWEGVKYYFADFVRKRGEWVPPKSVTYFLDQNQVFFEQKTQFLALFEEKISGKNQ